MEQVILVDENDKAIGTCEKLEAHKKNLLHRAFSIFLFNNKGEMLLQQRAMNKYHSGGLWTNACCSHQRPEEPTLDAAHRRLQEELGIDTELSVFGSLLYQVPFDDGLNEHEYDHLLIGRYENAPKLNPEEVMDFMFVDLVKLEDDISLNPDKYTYWFRKILEEKGEELKRAVQNL